MNRGPWAYLPRELHRSPADGPLTSDFRGQLTYQAKPIGSLKKFIEMSYAISSAGDRNMIFDLLLLVYFIIRPNLCFTLIVRDFLVFC